MRHLTLTVLLACLLSAGPEDQGALSVTPSLDTESVLFETPPAVETAALYTQTLQEAPANVTVITRQQIRRYGYRTLAEAVSNVRGFYVTHDGSVRFVGVRGFGLPGDYNTRVLVMLNGHFLTDNVYGAMYMFGQDFGLDMDLVERIEIVRGPSSALYGSNGVFATINIFTRAPADSPRAMVTTELGSFGEKKTLLSTSTYLGRGANLLLSASGFHTRGRTIEAPELGGLRTGSVEAEHGYHTFAQLTWRNWSVTANFSDRKAIAPHGWYWADFGDTGTSSRDAHNFVEAAMTRQVGLNAEIEWRLYYDQYRYYGRYDYTEEGVTRDARDFALGDWVGTRFAYRRHLSGAGSLTLGSQVDVDARNLQISEYVSPAYDRYREARHPNRRYGVFAQHVYELGKEWTLFSGLRLDDSRHHSAFLAPRLAAVWKQSGATSYKFMYGRAFRNPSTFEQFWEPNPFLEAEKIDTFEVAREQRLTRRLDLTASVFHYRLRGLIEGVPLDDNTLQYRNMQSGRANGAEVELSGQPARWLETAGSFSLQDVNYLHPGRHFPNSPVRLAQFRASVPLVRDRLILSTATRYMSSRLPPYGLALPQVLLADATATTNRLHRDFDLQFGVRNLADRRYLDPLSTEHLMQHMPRAGRTVFLKLIWRYGE